jgi:hypothetical protein
MSKAQPQRNLFKAGILILLLVFTFAFIYLLTLTSRESRALALATDMSQAMRSLEQDAGQAVSFTKVPGKEAYDPHQPDGGWSSVQESKLLVMSIPALSSRPEAEGSMPIYINQYGCFPDVDLETMHKNPRLLLDVIYFVKDGTLYRRITGTEPWVKTCGTAYLQRSCPENSADEVCPADTVVASSVRDWQVIFPEPDNNNDANKTDSLTATLTLENKGNIKESGKTQLKAGGL